jgi:hypothetical protein
MLHVSEKLSPSTLRRLLVSKRRNNDMSLLRCVNFVFVFTMILYRQIYMSNIRIGAPPSPRKLLHVRGNRRQSVRSPVSLDVSARFFRFSKQQFITCSSVPETFSVDVHLDLKASIYLPSGQRVTLHIGQPLKFYIKVHIILCYKIYFYKHFI